MSLTRVERVLQFLNKCGFRKPVIQTAFPNSMATTGLVARVCNSGALGVLRANPSSAIAFKNDIESVKSATHAPFGVHIDVDDDGAAIDNWIRVVLETKIPIVTFALGIPPVDIVKELQSKHTIVLGTATSVAEGVALQQGGCDAVIAQGYEAGGVRSSFLPPGRAVGTMALVPSLVDKMDETETPVIASGGIMDGRGVVAAFALGAAAVQMSSAFMICSDSGMPVEHKNKLRQGIAAQSTVLRRNDATGRDERVVDTDILGTPPLWIGQGSAQLHSDVHSSSAKDIISSLGKSSLSVMQEIEEIYQAVVRLRKLDHKKPNTHFSQYDD